MKILRRSATIYSMKCSSCGKKEGVVQVRQIIGEDKVEIWLCSECAHEHGIERDRKHMIHDNNDLLSGLLAPALRDDAEEERICAHCGCNGKELKKTGSVGCSECYSIFDKEITSMLNGISMQDQHRGKYPARLKSYKTFFIDRENIKKYLKNAIAREDYERAAVLRDRLKRMDNILEDVHD